MARHKYTVYLHPDDPRPEISEKKYNEYKSKLLEDPNAEINPHKLGVKGKIAMGLVYTISVPFLIFPGALESQINFIKKNIREKEFWANVKSMIINSNSYNQFNTEYRRKYFYIEDYLEENLEKMKKTSPYKGWANPSDSDDIYG
jgi:Fe-S cluster biosynthesis and repair protein YggX